MNGMEKITARMKEDAARSLSELNAQTEQELRRIREESAARAEKERETAGGRAHLAAQERYERLVLISKECDVNCSFETLLALSREKTERGAAKLLFAE